MTAEALHQHFIKVFTINSWPKSYEVDVETFGNVCKAVIRNNKVAQGNNTWVEIATGPHGGVMFKAVEIICREDHKL